MFRTTVGQLLINRALPEEYRDYDRQLDGKTVRELMTRLAKEKPEEYKGVLKRFGDVGREVAYLSGGFSGGVGDLLGGKVADDFRAKAQEQIRKILNSPGSDDQKQKQIIKYLASESKPYEENLFQEANEKKNRYALQVASGARGNKTQLKSLIGGDLLYVDHRENLIPIPIFRSYSKGLSPAEYFAASFGARAGLAATKLSVADAGHFGKILQQAAHRLVVSKQDSDDENYAYRGLPVPVDDSDSVGSYLSFPAGGYSRNTLITPKILADLKAKGIEKIVVRSTTVGGPPDGGVYAYDAGSGDRGDLPPIGEMIGITASHAIAEPVSQGGLSAKHGGGVAGATPVVGGFAALDQLVNVPKSFSGGAAHAQKDGTVESIQDAPAGGKYVVIDGQKNYVRAGFEIKVKPGDIIEAGDILSDGLPNPSEIVKHKGIGEGRRYFVDIFRKTMKDAGMSAHRRNLEVIARGLLDHVVMEDEYDDYGPDDVVPYSLVETHWEPRHDSEDKAVNSARGMYLERPVLHYTVGTKIRPSVIKTLSEFGIKNVTAHREPPPFRAEMVRGADNLQHDPDWMTRLLGSNLQRGLLSATQKGRISDPEGTSYVPSLVTDPAHFGQHGLTTQPQAGVMSGNPNVLPSTR